MAWHCYELLCYHQRMRRNSKSIYNLIYIKNPCHTDIRTHREYHLVRNRGSDYLHIWQQISAVYSARDQLGPVCFSAAADLHLGYPVWWIQGRRGKPFPVAIQNVDLSLPFRTRAGSRARAQSPGTRGKQREEEGRENGPTLRHFKRLPTEGYVATWLTR